MKRALYFVFISLLLFSMTFMSGCGKNNDNEENDGKNNNNTVSAEQKKPVSAAEEIVKLIIDKKWDDLMAYADIGDPTFLSGKDLEWFMPRSSLKNLSEFDSYDSVKGKILSESDTLAEVEVSITVSKDDVQIFDMPVQLKNNNTWGFDAKEFCIENWTIKSTGGNAELYINGIKADPKYIQGKLGDYNLYNKWVIPAVGKNTAKVEVKSDAFGTYTVEDIPDTNANDEEKFVDAVVVADAQTENAVFDAVKQLWNNSYNDYVAGKTAADCLATYIASDADTSMATNLWTYYKGLIGDKNNLKDFRITDIGKYSAPNVKFVYYLTDEIIGVNFGYKLEWEQTGSVIFAGQKSMNRLSNVYLKKEGGQYRFWKFSDEELFTSKNEWENEWNQART
jgi:hypothetical protein